MVSQDKTVGKTISQQLASYVHGLSYADLPDNVREIAQTRILEALSCAYDGHDLLHSKIIMQLIKNSSGSCTVFGYGKKASLVDGAMANAVLVHSTLQVDTLPIAGHPITMIVPVAIAIGEQEKASGKEVLTAIVIGYDIMMRLAMGMGHAPKEAYRTGPIVGAIGASAAAGKLMKLDTAKLANALGTAANIAPTALNQAWWQGTMEPVFHAAAAAQAAILATMLAKEGATAASDTFEGQHGFLNWWAHGAEKADRITEGLGTSFTITRVVEKPYPVSAGAQVMIQTALPLAKQGLKARDIREIIQRGGPGSHSYPGSSFAGPFTSHLQAIISVPFCIASTILGRPVEAVDLYANRYADAEIAELAGKIKLVEETDRKKPRTEIYTNDGRVLSAEQDPLNLESMTPSRKNVESRFLKQAPPLVGEKKAREILRLVMGMETMRDIRELTAKI
jgi:2-methylcitrate dehydratase PrpD